MVAFPTIVTAQNVTFSYDSAGNRIKREIVMKTRAVAKHEEPENYSEMLADKNIRIYPNPTKGMLKVEVIGYEQSDKLDLWVYDTAGRQLSVYHSASSPADLDISTQPNGIYILRILLNGKETSWKIIKK